MQLALELPVARVAVAVERTVGERAAHGAPRLPLVPAVVEAAPADERFDVAEGCVEPLAHVPQLQLAHARRVEQQPATGQPDELAARRRVPTAPVALADD